MHRLLGVLSIREGHVRREQGKVFALFAFLADGVVGVRFGSGRTSLRRRSELWVAAVTQSAVLLTESALRNVLFAL